eukprot:jgi/Ulvmu1/3091/UM015_0131.1
MRRGQSLGPMMGSGDSSPRRGPHVTDPTAKNKTSVVLGIIIYFGLVIAAFFLGKALPSQPVKSQPVPHDKRTICKRQPEAFDPSRAKGKKVLITGAAGFVGSHVARYCAQELDAEVIGLDDFSQGAGNVPFLSDIRIFKGDLANSTFLAGIFAKHSFDVIFHASELAGSAISHHFPSRMYEVNLVGTSNLVTHAVKSHTPRFIFVSSTAVYGKAPGPWAETSMTLPTDPYGVSKLAAEQHVRAAGEYFGLDYIILRTHSVYGPNMDFEAARSSLVARAVASTLTGAPVTIHGDGTQQRQFTYVGDVAALIAQAAFVPQLDFHVVNVGSNEISSVADVISAVETAAEKTLDAVKTPLVTDAHHVQAVHDRSWCMFDIKGFMSVQDGLMRTLEWARDAEVDVRPQHILFHAEIQEQGQGALATVLGPSIEVVEATYGVSVK